MRRVFTVLLTLSLVAGFATPRFQAAPDFTTEAPSAALDSATDVEGRGLFSAIGCVGCIGGGALIMAGGISAALTAAAVKGSALAAVTCFAFCKDAIDSAW